LNPACLRVARDLALQAAERLRILSRAPLQKQRKADHSWVTNADHEADRIIRSGLRKAFPEHSILTEESGMDGDPDSRYVWVIDPLDGTRAFVHGTPGYSVMIGLLKDGHPRLGVVVDPVEGHLYEAVEGEGAFHTLQNVRRRVQVSDREEWNTMPVITSTGFPEALQNQLAAELTGPWLKPVNSVGIKVGFVVRQLADLYINHHTVHFWDTCAPQIILEEAGGIMTDLSGGPLSYNLKGDHRHAAATLASNGARHQGALDILDRVMRRGT